MADTLEGALIQAYQNNPSLNAQRAALRATDEGVGIALSGYRPRISATITHGAPLHGGEMEVLVEKGFAAIPRDEGREIGANDATRDVETP